MLDNSVFRVVRGPYGSGKSTCMCFEVFRRASQQAPGTDGLRRTRWAIIRNTSDQLRDTTLKTFVEWFPEGVFGYYKSSEKTYFLEFGDIRAEIFFRALDDPDDVRKLKSLELTGAWVNESCEIHQDIVGPLRKRVGRYPSQKNRPADIPKEAWPTWYGVICDTNAPNIDSWWAKMMEKEIDNDWAVYKQPSGRSPMAENVENLPSDYYSPAGLTEDEIRVQIDGEYSLSKAGTPVYGRSFKRDFHVASAPLRAITADGDLTLTMGGVSTRPLIIGLDCGLTPAATICQVGFEGRAYVLAEATAFDMGMQRFLRTVLKPLLAARFPGLAAIVVVDPAAKQRAQTNEVSVEGVIKSEGLRVILAKSNDHVPRKAAVERMLMRQVDGKAGLLIDPSCRMLIQGLAGGYRFKPSKDGSPTEVIEKSPHSHVCFVAGTKISTPTGPRAVETLKIGDLVDTPIGPRPVVAAMARPAHVRAYDLTNGTTLTTTPDHPVFTQDGFVPAEALEYAHHIAGRGVAWRILFWCRRFEARWPNGRSMYSEGSATTSGGGTTKPTAARLASLLRAALVGMMTRSARVLSAAARFAAVNTGARAPVRVAAASGLRQEVVYNIEVADAHAYYAEGVLVSNCESLEYAMMHIDDDLTGRNTAPRARPVKRHNYVWL